MSSIYDQHAQAFAGVSAYVILNGAKERVGTVAFRHGHGTRTWCYFHVHGVPMVRGFADGGGYDKASAAAWSAVHKIEETGLADWPDCLATIRAHWADRLAERSAESARDYNRAWRAGRRFEELGDDVAEARSACLALIREARAACLSIAALPAVKAALRARVESLVDDIREAREERAQLLADYGREPAFTEG